MQHHIVLFSILGAVGYIVIAMGLYLGSALSADLTHWLEEATLPLLAIFGIWPLILAFVIASLSWDALVWVHRRLNTYPHALRQRIIDWRIERENAREDDLADQLANRERAKRQREKRARQYELQERGY